MGGGFNIPWIGVRYAMGRGGNIPLIGGVKIPWKISSIYQE